MKKRYIFLIVILIIIGVPMLNFYRMKQEINQEMQSVARSEHAKELIEEHIKRKDPKAFTDEGYLDIGGGSISGKLSDMLEGR